MWKCILHGPADGFGHPGDDVVEVPLDEVDVLAVVLGHLGGHAEVQPVEQFTVDLLLQLDDPAGVTIGNLVRPAEQAALDQQVTQVLASGVARAVDDPPLQYRDRLPLPRDRDVQVSGPAACLDLAQQPEELATRARRVPTRWSRS